MLSITELQQPRFKLIADYPGNLCPVGKIYCIASGHDTCHSLALTPSVMARYPHLFKRLQWWEERAAADMPNYVGHQMIPGHVRKVIKFRKWDVDVQVEDYDHDASKEGVCCAEVSWPIDKVIPATEDDYKLFHQLMTA
jgi:hypothetical protein